tara:strand:+ start:1444 stop:3090 length:1647 start_codon:yes stop_codon:yes gene_type:complete
MSNKNFAVEKQNIIDLFKQKKFSKISKISPKIRSLFEDQADIVKIIVMSDLNSKNFSKAENLLIKALIYNNSAEFNYILGNTLKIQDKNDEAIIAYKKSLALNENFSEAYNNLANVQKKIERFDDALLNYKNAIRSKEDNIEAYYNLANLFKSLKNYDEAIKNYKNVIKLNPNFSDAYNNIGTIYSILGKFNDAREFYLKSIKINKFFAEPYKNYVQLSKIDQKDEVFEILKEIVKKKDLDEEQKEVFFYSISKIYFDVGDDDLAFKYLNLANKLKLTKYDYSFNKEKKEFKKIKEFFSQKKIINLKNFKKNKITPIFILGMPRSGTSLIEQIISNHSEVHGAGELDLLPITVKNSDWKNSNDFEETLQKVRKNYLEKISLLSNKNYITDKLPGNFKRIGFILNAIPDSKIIHLERNPMAICWSNYKSNFNSTGMAFTLNQEFTAMYYLLYRDLMKFWKEKYSEKIINVNYESFVENFEEEIKKLFDQLNLKWEKQLYDFHKNERPVETASLIQVRSKIYKKSSEQWKNYKKHLKPMTDILSLNNVEY